MTKQEKVIVSTYTGVLMCDFSDVHEYVEEKLGRPIFTHEFADRDIQKEIKEKSKEDFLKICSQEEPKHKELKWNIIKGTRLASCKCGYVIDRGLMYNFCPICGADMRGEQE